jgi:hypothetical protein
MAFFICAARHLEQVPLPRLSSLGLGDVSHSSLPPPGRRILTYLPAGASANMMRFDLYNSIFRYFVQHVRHLRDVSHWSHWRLDHDRGFL